MVANPWDQQGKWQAGSTSIAPTSIARPVILKDGQGLLMAVVPLTHRLSLDTLNQQLGRSLAPAEKSDYEFIFSDCSGKLLPALGDAYSMEAVVNNELLEQETVHIASGNENELIRLAGTEFQRLLGGARFGRDFSRTPEKAADKRPAGQPLLNAVEQIRKFTDDEVASRPDIRQRIQSTTKLPGMPSLAYKIIQLNANPYAHAEDLAKLVEKDPSLTAQIVRYAQSPFYGYQGKVTSVRQAISRVLGYDMVMNIALGVAAARPFRIPATGPMGLNEFWRHSTYSATLTQALCNLMPRTNRPRIGTAYLCSLLHNFGFLLLGHLFPKEFRLLQNAIRQQPDMTIIDVERKELGITHMEMGALLMDAWNMPPEVTVVQQEHHNWNYDGPHASYVHLVHIGNCLLKTHDMGDEASSEIPPEILHALGIDAVQMRKVLERTVESSEDLDSLARQLVA